MALFWGIMCGDPMVVPHLGFVRLSAWPDKGIAILLQLRWHNIIIG